MKKQFVFEAEIPDKVSFRKKYRQFNNVLDGIGKGIYDIIMTPETLHRAIAVTEQRLPAVSVVAEQCSQLIPGLGDNKKKENILIKQLAGALICHLMEANGYKKTGIKRSIPHDDFSKGEFYEIMPTTIK